MGGGQARLAGVGVLCRLVGAGLEEAGWRVTCTLFFWAGSGWG